MIEWIQKHYDQIQWCIIIADGICVIGIGIIACGLYRLLKELERFQEELKQDKK